MDIKTLESFKLGDSIKFHDQLNQKLFVNNKPRPEVKKQLLLIAKDFMSELGIKNIDIEDITISGSNAAYTYTKHSDVDLHILVNFNKLPNNDVYRELLNAKKTIYNDTHNIKVHGIPVEVYVQDSNEPVISLGEYSLLKNKWLRIPTKRRANFDQTLVRHKYSKLHDLIELALKSKNLNKIQTLLKTLHRYRQAGLDKGGEFSPENLAYKSLRSQGYITKLYQLRDQLHSKRLSIENIQENKDLSHTDKKVSLEPTLNYFNESHKQVTYCPYFSKENLTETEQYLNKVNGTVPVNIWLTLLEQFLGNKYLIEDKVSEIASQVNRIENLSIKNPIIGKKYIPIPILVLSNNIFIMDISGKDDLQTPAQPLPLVKINNNVYSFKFKDILLEYPFNTTYKSVYSTVIIASIETYDKIRVLIQLYFDKSLPPIKKTNIEENSSKYIFPDKEKNNPRYKTISNIDIKSDTVGKGISSNWNLSPANVDYYLLKESMEEYFKKDKKHYPHRIHGVHQLVTNYKQIIESVESEVKEFWNYMISLDQRSKVDLSPGKSVSVIQCWTHLYDSVFELRGNLIPKEIVDVDYDYDGKVRFIQFMDGTTFPDKSFLDRGQGSSLDGIITIFYPNKRSADQALTLLYLNVPNNWKLSKTNLIESAVTESSGYIPSEKEKNDPRFETALKR